MPPVPPLPSSWTVVTTVGYVASLATFILGLLTSFGVTLPAHVAADVQAVAGASVTIAGVVAALITTISAHSVQKAAIKAQAAVTVAGAAHAEPAA